MDVITTAARTGIAIRGSTLYATTFPCHDCARHIVASGITNVVYVEPYPKSRVAQLHDDFVRVVDDHTNDPDSKVLFRPFIGISHLRLSELYSHIERKHDDRNDLGTYGLAKQWTPGPDAPIRETIVGNKLMQNLRAEAIKETTRHARDTVERARLGAASSIAEAGTP